MAQYRVVWTDSKRHNKRFKGDWVGKAMMLNWKRDSAPKLGPNIDYEIQKKGA